MLKQMQYFKDVVDCQSFTKAAECSYISQSAISQQIIALEAELHVTLLNRKQRSFSLTPAGEYFYQQSKEILQNVDELRIKVQNIADEGSILKIGYLKSFAGKEMNEALIAFSYLYPDVNVQLLKGSHEELYKYLKNDQVNLVISDQRRAFHEDYVNEHLIYVDVYLEISRNHPLANKDVIDIEEINNMPCILLASKEQQEIERDFFENILGIKSRFIYAENIEEARLMVSMNRGVLPIEYMKAKNHESKDLVIRPLFKKNKHIQRNYCAFWQKRFTNDFIEKYVVLLKEIITKSLED